MLISETLIFHFSFESFQKIQKQLRIKITIFNAFKSTKVILGKI